MAANVTLRQISKRAGVAPITCSRVLNGSAGRVYVADPTRQRVLRAARELGYLRHMTANAMRTGRTGAIGLVGISPDHAFPPPMLWGVEETAATRDRHLIVAQLRPGSIEHEMQLPRMLRERATDGLLIHGLGERTGEAMLTDRLSRLGAPVIRLGEPLEADCVRIDVRAAATDAAERLVRAGHRRIAVVRYHGNSPDRPLDLHEAFARGLAEAGLTAESIADPSLAGRPDHQQSHAHYMLRQRGRPTAIFACGRAEAEACAVAALRLGLKMPEQLALIAAAGQPIDVGGFTVATMVLPLGQLGRVGVRMLCTKIDRPDRLLAPQVLHHRFVPGQTV